MSEKLFHIQGKTALVTGASRGIGLTLARGLGQAGAHLILNGRNQQALDEAVELLAREAVSYTHLTLPTILLV